MYKQRTFLLIFFICGFTAPSMAQTNEPSPRQRIDLAGAWKCRLDSQQVGVNDKWYGNALTEDIRLPGTLEENKKGNRVEQTSTQYLNQTYKYEGAAWYQKAIDVPAAWAGKHITLFLERTKTTQVWVDDQLIGRNRLLSAPQVYDLTGKLSPGRHRITIRIDNDPKLTPVGGSHAISEHTQTNWNGIIGSMYLEALNSVSISKTRITPDVENKTAHIEINIRNDEKMAGPVTLELSAAAWNSTSRRQVKPLRMPINLQGCDTVVTVSLPMGKKALLWSEYHPALYQLTVRLRNGQSLLDMHTEHFGMRRFSVRFTQFQNNGVFTFLRGKNDVCIFPLTGYVAMDTASWRRLFRIAKTYGINHYRFHSYTPPEAAFLAADVEGIYIQSELPLWGNFRSADTAMIRFQYEEGKAIFDALGNHASFVMFTLGNELAGDAEVHNKLVADFRQYDGGRRLYAFGTNAFFNNPKPGTTDDFWVTMRTGKETPDGKFDVRGSFATTEDVNSGILNTQPPSTRRHFRSAISDYHTPVVGHEVGQYQVYPDYREMNQYTGVLRPANLAIFKKRLTDAGMGRLADSFFRASGKLAALLYREEVEMAFRTPGFAGFQLLDLQDFPGQGTALVGLLNAFMQSKGLITPKEFRRFNNDVVLQLLMDQYAWRNNELFSAGVQLVNYSPAAISGKKMEWKMVEAATGKQVAAGKMTVRAATPGAIHPLGQISVSLQNISTASKLLVQLKVSGTDIEAEYPVWVYPASVAPDVPEKVTVASTLSDEVLQKLTNGARVVLFPDHKQLNGKTVKPQFISEFWNWLIFKGGAERQKRPVSAGTLGNLIDTKHPIFKTFPTEFHSNWQWWRINKNAHPLILDKTDSAFGCIVQVIDNIDRNHKLGMIFECKVGSGKLLVCMANLPALKDHPEARQLHRSMLQYAGSEAFDPVQSIDPSLIQSLLKPGP